MTPSASPSRSRGIARAVLHPKAWEAATTRVSRQSDGDGIFVLRGGEVVHVHGLAIEDGAPGRPVTADRPPAEIGGKGNRPVMSRNLQVVAVAQQHDGVIGAAQTAGRLHQPLQNGLHVVGG